MSNDQGQPEEDDRFVPSDLPPGMANFTYVLLRRPENAPEFTEEELEHLQAGHLADLLADRHLAVSARHAGDLVLGGAHRCLLLRSRVYP